MNRKFLVALVLLTGVLVGTFVTSVSFGITQIDIMGNLSFDEYQDANDLSSDYAMYYSYSEMFNLLRDDTVLSSTQLADQVVRMLYSLFDDVYFIDVDETLLLADGTNAEIILARYNLIETYEILGTYTIVDLPRKTNPVKASITLDMLVKIMDEFFETRGHSVVLEELPQELQYSNVDSVSLQKYIAYGLLNLDVSVLQPEETWNFDGNSGISMQRLCYLLMLVQDKIVQVLNDDYDIENLNWGVSGYIREELEIPEFPLYIDGDRATVTVNDAGKTKTLKITVGTTPEEFEEELFFKYKITGLYKLAGSVGVKLAVLEDFSDIIGYVYYNSKIIGLVVQEETDVTGWSEIYRFEYAGKTGMVVYADPMYWTPAVGLSFMKYDHNLGFGQTQSYLDLDQISSFRLLVNYYYVFCGESVLFDNVTPESYLKDETGILAGAGYESLDEYFTGITKEYLYKDEISGKDLRWETPFSVLDWIANGVVQNKTIYDVVFAVGYWNGSEFVRSIGYYQDRKAVPFLSEEDEIYDEIMELYSGKNTPPTEYVGALPYTDGYPLRAGELSEEYMQWCADMINIYRIGTGLRGIVIGENSNEYMQDATAYSAYIYKDIGRRSLYMDGTHYIKDDGVVSKEILDKAVAASFSGAIMPGGSNVASGIRALVHDNFPGAKYLRGHRHTLLSQVIEALGIGSVPIYGTGRYSIITGWGSTVYNDLPKVVGFPAVGVSLHELTGNMVDRWSVQLENNKYYFGTNASVTIKRLNDGREWKYGKIDGMERFFSSVTIASWNGYDILLRAGDVYEVTLSGIMELYTWQSAEDFVYRTVIR